MLYPNVYGPRCMAIGMPHPGFEEGFWNNTVQYRFYFLFLYVIFLKLPVSVSNAILQLDWSQPYFLLGFTGAVRAAKLGRGVRFPRGLLSHQCEFVDHHCP